MAKALVSIIIATYNEAGNIKPLLQSCRGQTYQPIEIIVVDSKRTTDVTSKLARKYTSRIYIFGIERSSQRNHGVSKAHGKYVLVLDADMVLDKNIISSCIEKIKSDSKLVALIIPEKSYGESYWAKCKALERNCYIGDPQIEAPRFFRKDIFLTAGGYNPQMISGEDWDLRERIKKMGKVGRINKFILHNEGKISLLKDLKKKLYYSRNSDAYLKDNVKSVKQILLYIFRPAYFRNWKMLLSDPIHFVGFLVMKSLELSVGGMVILSKPNFWRKIVK